MRSSEEPDCLTMAKSYRPGGCVPVAGALHSTGSEMRRVRKQLAHCICPFGADLKTIIFVSVGIHAKNEENILIIQYNECIYCRAHSDEHNLILLFYVLIFHLTALSTSTMGVN